MIVGGYSVDLYCDSGIEQPYGTPGHEAYDYGDTFTGETRARCLKQARRKGWVIQGERVICPTCAPIVFAKKKKGTSEEG